MGVVSWALGSELFCCTVPGGAHSVGLPVKGPSLEHTFDTMWATSAARIERCCCPACDASSTFISSHKIYILWGLKWEGPGRTLLIAPLWNPATPHINMHTLGQKVIDREESLGWGRGDEWSINSDSKPSFPWETGKCTKDYAIWPCTHWRCIYFYKNLRFWNYFSQLYQVQWL